jgi:glycosyltransferase involved in cell wall biosynthesis
MRVPKRVVFYTDARELGGAERSLANLVASLSPQLEVTIMGVERRVVDEIAAGRRQARTQVLPFVTSRYDAPSVLAHAKALLAHRADVFHANLISPWSCQMAIFLAVLVPRTRVVAVEQLPVPPANAQQRRVKRLLAPRLAAHVAVGERSAREVERIVGLRPGSVRTIHNGVPDIDLPSPGPRYDAGLTIGAVGRLEAQKGFDILLRALARLPQASATFVGEGRERSPLERLAAELGVADRVRWVGWSETPRAHLSGFDVLAFPSRFEGFPLAVLEAMLAEVPVVASDVGSLAEVVRHRDTGLLVPREDPGALAEALDYLLSDAGRRAAMGKRARTLVLERYTAAAMARSFESLYAEICT